MSKHTWHRVGPAVRGEHRLFRRDADPALYIADESGKTPDETDDGPIRILDFEGAVVLRPALGGFTAALTCVMEGLPYPDARCTVQLSPVAALALADVLDRPVCIAYRRTKFHLKLVHEV